MRKLGYGVTESAVELSSNTPARTTVTMADFVPRSRRCASRRRRTRRWPTVGYLERKQPGFGYFLDGEQINHASMMFSDVMRTVPGLKIQPSGDGRTSVITDSRSASDGCVNYFVDGMPWTTMTPGDIDDFVRPNEMVAVEVYHGSRTPPQYQVRGPEQLRRRSSCGRRRR